MSLMSALGWVARTVLVNGSSTGFTPPPRGAPRRASRRRTAAPPLVPGGGAGEGAAGAGAPASAGSAAGPAAGSAAGPAAGSVAGPAAGSARPGTAASRVTSPLSPEAGKSCCPGADEVTSASAVPVVATSPVTCAPVVRQGPILSAAARPHVLASRCGAAGLSPTPVTPQALTAGSPLAAG